jgi:2-polyprenyl-3-methyl-5-hydroxy-6-metoxy-1,4-benzoquinol methylase
MIRLEAKPRCEICGSTGAVAYQSLRDRLYSVSGSWDLDRCPKCDLLWLNPAPVKEDIHLAYRNYYTHMGSVNHGLRGVYRALADIYVRRRLGYPTGAGIAQTLMAHLLALLHPGGEAELTRQALYLKRPIGSQLLLEVGCGNGELLAYMSKLGWRVEGVETDPDAVEAARSLGLNVHEGSVEDQHYGAEYADVICVVHVIEHIFEPSATLRECARILKPGGQLIIVTPNSASLGHRWFRVNWMSLDAPRHLMVLSPSNIGLLASQAGLIVRSVRTTARGARSTWTLGQHLRRAATWDTSGGPPSLRSHLKAVPFQLLERFLIALGHDVGEELVVTAQRAP